MKNEECSAAVGKTIEGYSFIERGGIGPRCSIVRSLRHLLEIRDEGLGMRDDVGQASRQA